MFETESWWWLAWLGLGLAVAGALALGPLLFGRMFAPGLTLALFRRFNWVLSGLLDRISPGLDLRLLVRAGNRYFRKAFAATPFQKRLLFLPFCLRPLDCPAEVDPEIGLCCQGGCPGCQVGLVRAEALQLGYAAVYVVPSSRMIRGRGLLPSDEFIRSKISQHGTCAALGVTCPWHMRNRLLARHTVRSDGYRGSQDQARSVLQGVLMDDSNCRRGSVNWERVRRCLVMSQDPI
ncbi:MAG: DUF116 domain-containing protein [Thermodesulfobacteriota bacterium]